MHKAVVAKALYPATLVVHRNQQIWTQAFDAGAQLRQLRPIFPIAPEQNHAADQWVA